jgi:hypothetical protein
MTTTIPILENLQGSWSSLQILVQGSPVQLPDIYPFTRVADLKRQLWASRGGDPRWAPERVFLGVRGPAGIRPIEFHWSTTVMGGDNIVDLPDPRSGRAPFRGLVDEAGNRKPVSPDMHGGLILETALSPEIIEAGGALPVIEAISLAELAEGLTPEALTAALYDGYYRLFFPWLSAPAQVLDSATATAQIRDSYAATIPYLENLAGRIQIVQDALARRQGGVAVQMLTMVRLRWTMPVPARSPESLEKTFYGLHASATLPFLRYFPASGGTPLLKLGLEADGTPIIKDPRIFTQYINQPAPATKSSAVIVARVPMASPHVERGAAFTIHMFESGASDITLEVPQRGATYIAAVAADAERVLRDVLIAIGFPTDVRPVLHNLHATYKWTHPDPRRSAPLSAARLKARVAALTPFFDQVPAVAGDTALAVFQWRAVSNYDPETAQFSFITQLVLRGSLSTIDGLDALRQFTGEISKRFGLTPDAAEALLERWLERRGEAVAPAAGPAAGAHAVARHSTGASVAISGSHPEYSLEVQDVASAEELQRLVSVVAVILGAPRDDLRVEPPAPAVEAVVAAVEVADEVAVEAAAAAGPAPEEDMGELDPAMADLMAQLGFGSAEEEEVAEEAPALVVEEAEPEPEAAPAPVLEAAMAAVDEECRGNPWRSGEAALKIKPDWYMAKLKMRNTVLFGYPADKTGRTKTYSKSCQRRDDRQPNIMTLEEYARVRRCYEDQVRFVDLPPRKPTDLPRDPKFNPKGRGFSVRENPIYYMMDPESGKPMWAVYGYENKTRPGEFLYLMCAELWCDRDNLPILRSEFEGTQGRGFSKPADSCPFCGGAIIANMDTPKPGESVVVRMPKESTGKLHSFVGTITRNKHPKGYPLPCCDTTPRLLKKYMDAAYYGTLIYGKELADDDDEEAAAPVLAAVDEDAEPPPEVAAEAAMMGPEGGTVDYRRILDSMQTQYILGNDKALDAGKIGLLPPAVDAFFGQNGPQALESRGIRPTFREGTHLFVHIGVDNSSRTPGLNLFAGLAPLLGFDSAEQARTDILTKRVVRAFESANYGTLVQEFAAKSRLSDAQVSSKLSTFADEFRYPLDRARGHVIRLYKAWTAFLEYLGDYRTPKQIRHLEHMLAQPGVFTPRGLMLIVLEQEGDQVRIACPSFGIPTASLFNDVPVAFMLHDRRDESWEPIVLYNNTRSAIRFFGDAVPELANRGLRTAIQKWIRDWRDSSAGCGRPAPPPHVWTPDRDTTGLPRLSQVLRRRAVALVRDRSNRLAGVVITGSTDQPIFVPCLDDGNLADRVPRMYEAEMLPTTPVDIYVRQYQELSTEFAGLRPVKLLTRMEDTSQIVGFEIEAGAKIPTGASATGSKGDLGLPEHQVDMFPWERDALILRSPDAPAFSAAAMEESTASVEEQLAEAYQHVRLTLSLWLTRDARGPRLRQDLAALIKAGLPLYEKRKRMDLTLEPILREWVSAEETTDRRTLSLLRQDCLALPQEQCTGSCAWSSRGCLIHAPVRSATMEPVRIFTARLTDEILRYTAKRNEILEADVAEIRIPKGIVRMGSELYMATKPKETAQTIMERLGFTGAAPTAFPEEMIRFEGLEEEAEPRHTDESVLPTSWAGLSVARPTPDLEDAGRLVFAAITERDIPEWEAAIQKRRADMGLAGDPTRPFQWSVQDFYVIATIKRVNILFVRLGADGGPQISRWIQPARGVAPLGYMIFWGPQELLVSMGKQYVLAPRDLPSNLRTALDAASPIPEEEARGFVAEATTAAPELAAEEGEAVAPEVAAEEGEATAAPELAAEEEADAGEAPPELVVSEAT